MEPTTTSPPQEREKKRITVTDFLPQWEKYPTGQTDAKGKQICYGHTVLYRGSKHLIAYRYGETMLKQPFTIHALGIKDYTQVEVLNDVTAAADWLIIGHSDEPLIAEMMDKGVFED